MKKLSISALSVVLLSLGSVAFAQENGTPAGGYCPHISQNLSRGMSDATTGGQVTELQKFLVDYYDLNPADSISGFFGRITQQNVIKFQREQGLPTSGFVGPLTRAAIARVCAGTTAITTPPPTNPLSQNTAPTCVLSLSPASISLGQSATLSWTSTNASGGTIIPIGNVGPSGSQTTSPLQTTTFTGTFSSASGASAHCAIVLTVGQSAEGSSCLTPWGDRVGNGSIVVAYQASSVSGGQQCVSEQRTCTNGTLSGSYANASCSAAAACTPDSPQTQTLACPTGQTGAITQTRTSTCAAGATASTWGAWTTTANTCVAAATTGVTTGFWDGQNLATFNATPSSGAAPLTVTYGGSVQQYFNCEAKLWNGFSIDPGDGSGTFSVAGANSPCDKLAGTSWSAGVSHTYSAPGTYTAKLYNSNVGQVLLATAVTVTGTSASANTCTVATASAFVPAVCPTDLASNLSGLPANCRAAITSTADQAFLTNHSNLVGGVMYPNAGYCTRALPGGAFACQWFLTVQGGPGCTQYF